MFAFLVVAKEREILMALEKDDEGGELLRRPLVY